jgi:hypothetical protein
MAIRSCDPDIFKQGQGVCVAVGEPDAIEHWVQAVAKKTDAKLDWHYSGGRANVLHLGDDASRQHVLEAIHEMESELKGQISVLVDRHCIEQETLFLKARSLLTQTSVQWSSPSEKNSNRTPTSINKGFFLFNFPPK